MFEVFEYSFMVRALLAGSLVAILLPVLGSFLVARRYSLIADSLAHVSLAGIGAGLVFGASPTYVALPVAIAGAVALEALRRHGRLSGEIGLAILMSSGLAGAVVLANLAQTSSVDFSSYLFGSIATTGWADVWLLAALTVGVAAFVAVNYRSLMHIAFDEDSARVAGIRVSLLNYVLVGCAAAVVVLGLRIVGGLLIGALLVIPIVAAAQVARSFTRTLFAGVAIAIIATISGLMLSFYSGVSAGGAIVLSALLILVLAFVWRR